MTQTKNEENEQLRVLIDHRTSSTQLVLSYQDVSALLGRVRVKKREKVCCIQNSLRRTFSGRSGVPVKYWHHRQNDAGHLKCIFWLDLGLFLKHFSD